jgi:4-hydroxybenzoate polyprenyltransferase
MMSFQKITNAVEFYIRFLRIIDFLPLIGLSFMGYIYNNLVVSLSELFKISLIAFLYLAQGYATNNYFDYDIDSIRKNPIVKSSKLRRYGGIIVIFLISFFVLLNYLLFKEKSIILLTGVIVSLLYSSKHTRLKRFMLPRIILNSLGFTLLFIFGGISFNSFNNELFFMSVIIFFTIIPFEIVHLECDSKDDKNLGLSLRNIIKNSLLLNAFIILIVLRYFIYEPATIILNVIFQLILIYFALNVNIAVGFKRKLLKCFSLIYGVVFIWIKMIQP